MFFRSSDFTASKAKQSTVTYFVVAFCIIQRYGFLSFCFFCGFLAQFKVVYYYVGDIKSLLSNTPDLKRALQQLHMCEHSNELKRLPHILHILNIQDV